MKTIMVLEHQGDKVLRKFYRIDDIAPEEIVEILSKSTCCTSYALLGQKDTLVSHINTNLAERFKKDLLTVLKANLHNYSVVQSAMEIYQKYFEAYQIRHIIGEEETVKECLVINENVPLNLRKKVHKFAKQIVLSKTEEELTE